MPATLAKDFSLAGVAKVSVLRRSFFAYIHRFALDFFATRRAINIYCDEVLCPILVEHDRFLAVFLLPTIF
jgi:hypothetical protein